MERLILLFTKDGLQYQILKKRCVINEDAFFIDENTPDGFISQKLDKILNHPFGGIDVISAINHFATAPLSFTEHELGYDLIAHNAAVDKDNEELMLAINKAFKIQFYYTLPKIFYQKIKTVKCPTIFNFSGEKFLNNIMVKGGKENTL